MSEIRRIYTDEVLYERYEAAFSKDYFNPVSAKVDETENAVVLPLKKFLNETGNSCFQGGVVEANGVFFEPSAHIHNLENDIGSLKSAYVFNKKDVAVCDETVIYGGVLFDHFGHFLVESVNRLWYVVKNRDQPYPIVFIKEMARKLSPHVIEFFKLLGIDKERLVFIDKPTRFSKIIVPCQSGVLSGYYSELFMLPYQIAAAAVDAKPCERVYLSRRRFKNGITIYGEEKLEKAFKANGFKVIYPERLSLRDQIAYIKGAKEIASIVGSATHLSLFAKNGTKNIVLERTEHINKEQILINQANCLDWYSINANMNYLPVGHEFSPILMGVTDSAAAFFKDHLFAFDEKDVNRISDRAVRKFNRAFFARYSSSKYNGTLTGIDPVYARRIKTYCSTAFLSLRQRLFMKRTEGEYRVWSVLGFSFKTKRYQNISASVRDIPIYIISFNRLSYLKSLVSWLEKAGCANIHIVDNASTYPPLLDYLAQTKHTVHRMEKNYGHTVLFDAPEFKDVVDNQYFVLSDPDILPVEDCPSDFMRFLYGVLERFPNVTKAGISLKLDDLPDHYALKETVIKWESAFYKKALKGTSPALYKAPIDTTFALYRPRKEWKKGFAEAIRTGFPYQARHLPWYKDLNKLTEEDRFYNASDTGAGNWNGTKIAVNFQMTEKSYVKLFGFLPVMKIKRKKNKKTFLLFCCLPVYRKKENS